MRAEQSPMRSITTKFLLPVAALAVLSSSFVFYRTYRITRAHTQELIDQQGRLALEFDLAIRSYVAEQIRPVVEAHLPEGEFIPEAMSTSRVARGVFDKVRRSFPEYLLKFSSDDPRNPVNQASVDEQEVIDYFNAHPEVSRWAGRITLEGREYHAHFSARRMKASCLRCHGRPEDAPASLLERYGDQAGFHRPVGEIIALDTIGIPAEKTDHLLRTGVVEPAVALVVCILLLFVGVALLFRCLVGRRIRALGAHFERIAAQPDRHRLKPVAVRGHDEIAGMARSFNTLVAQLGAAHASLEERVAQRTAELAATNQRLQHEVAERGAAEEKLRLLHQNLPGARFTVNADCMVEDVNDVFCAVTGYTRSEVVGESCRLFCTKAEGECPVRSRSRDRLDNEETSVRARDGRIIPVVKSARRFHTSEGETVVETFLDITDRQRAEEALRATHRQLQDIIEFLPDATFVINQEGRVVSWNRAMEEFTGIPKADMLGKGEYEYAIPFYGQRRPMLIDLVGHRDPEAESHYDFVEATDHTLFAEVYMTPVRGGRGAHVWGTASALLDEDGNLVGAIESVRDVTERKQAEQAIAETKRLQEGILSNIPDLAWLKDEGGRFTSVNEPFARACGRTVGNVIGKTDFDIWPQEYAERYRQNDLQVMATAQRLCVEEPLQHHDGRLLWIETIKTPIFNSRNEVIGTTGIARDITERRQAAEKLKQYASKLRGANYELEVQKQQLRAQQQDLLYQNEEMEELTRKLGEANAQLTLLVRIDPLTHLLNRRAWQEAVETEHGRADRYGRPYSIVILDVDHFKRFNDSQGHQAGDVCLERVAASVSETCRSCDAVGRYGGEEFVVLAPETDHPAAVALAERIRQAVFDLNIPHAASPVVPQVTVSAGVAACHGDSWESVVKRADDALYAAKDAGRNQVCTEDPAPAGAAPATS